MADFAPEYVDVAERLRVFREKYPEGSLRSDPHTLDVVGEMTFVTVRAEAYRTPEDPAPGVGMAWEPVPGRTPFTRNSELQNAETSAWGRAIVAVLAADTKRVASAEEVRNRQAEREPTDMDKALAQLRSLCVRLKLDPAEVAVTFKDTYDVDIKNGEPWQVEALMKGLEQ